MNADDERANHLASAHETEDDGLDESEADLARALLEEAEATLPPLAGIPLEGIPPNGAAADAGTRPLPNPFDPLGLGKSTMDVWKAMLANPQGLLAGQMEFAKA